MTAPTRPAPVVKVHRVPDRPGHYEVSVDGVRVRRTIYRREGVSAGYFGRWACGTTWFSTRAQAVEHVVARHLDHLSRGPQA